MPRVSVDLSPGTFAALGEICAERHQKKADFFRELLEVYMNPIPAEEIADHVLPSARLEPATKRGRR